MKCSQRFENKVVIITGASSGIGLATAIRVSSEGGRVVMVAKNADKLKEAAVKVREAGGPGVLVQACDVSDQDQVKATYAAAVKEFGDVHSIVNNAGLMVFKPLVEHTIEDWMSVLHVDLMGAFFFVREAFLKMRPGGTIVNVASVHAVETTPLVASYAAAKAALLSLTRSASIEGKPKGLRVNAVLPGAVATPMLWDNPNIKAGLEVINKADVGQPEDLAAAIAYLASPDSVFIQGAGLLVDGGRLAQL